VSRTAELIKLGFKNFDALHLAVAEQAGADAFACCDDRLLGVAGRNSGGIKVRVVEILELAKELLK
jgi:hypothetical protein